MTTVLCYPKSSAVLLAALSIGLSHPLSAQVPADSARARSSQTLRAPEISTDGPSQAAPGEVAPKMEGDSEYGVQKILYRRSNPEPFNVSLDLGYYYTDNVALVERGKQDDFFLRSGLRLSYTPQLKGNLFFSTSAGSEVYRYHDASFFDFDLLSFDAGLLHATPRQGTAYDPLFADVVSWLRYSFYRISEPWDWGDSVFDNHSIVLGFQKTWRISRGHQLFAGANADWSLDAGEPLPQRDEYSVFAGYKVKWTPDLESNLVYRAASNEYQEFDRSDINQVVSLGLTYQFNDWLAATGSFSAVFNDSDRSAFDYESLNTGVTLVLTARW